MCLYLITAENGGLERGLRHKPRHKFPPHLRTARKPDCLLAITVAYGFNREIRVHSVSMALKITSAEEIARRWAEGESRAIREALQRPRNRAHEDWALGFGSLFIRKLTRKGNRQRLVSLPDALLRMMGLENCERVIFIPLPEGGGYIRAATPDEIEAARSLLSDCAPPMFAEAKCNSAWKVYTKHCLTCGASFLARSPRRNHCDTCYPEHKRKLKNESWHRRGKLRPSYLAKHKPRGAPDAAQMALSV